MRAHGQVAVWGTHVGVGHAGANAGWLQRVREWWAARRAARRQAVLSAVDGRWDARRESLQPLHTDAAPEMAAAQGALTVVTVAYGMTI